MAGNFLIDTNIVITLIRGEDILRKRFNKAREILVPSIVVGELFFGAYKSGKTKKNLDTLAEFISKNRIVPCDAETAREFGFIKNELREKGRPIPDNDIWIAAMAIQHSLTLVTRDKHFNEIDRLDKTCW